MTTTTVASTSAVPPAVIVGAGRVGAALAEMGDGRDVVRS